ncbi:3'-5' exonuclease-like [Rutidosis leptorrhynchoides]|uniref:3'-5' exonuclease-like n=1 Tax=Rutidosis leptorrhynchoides TaxID=125765 RepID=UPI003A997BA5
MTTNIYNHRIPDSTHDEYTITFYHEPIHTLVTATPSLVDAWISQIESIHQHRLNRLIVGLDIEWRPPNAPQIVNPVATLQLCVGRRCLIFQIVHAEYFPYSLWNFLNNPLYTFMGVGIGDDVAKLRRDYNIGVASYAELGRLAAEQLGAPELNRSSLKDLARRVLGADIEKPTSIRRSNWDDQYLTDPQVKYACIDAFLGFEIARNLIQGFDNYN